MSRGFFLTHTSGADYCSSFVGLASNEALIAQLRMNTYFIAVFFSYCADVEFNKWSSTLYQQHSRFSILQSGQSCEIEWVSELFHNDRQSNIV